MVQESRTQESFKLGKVRKNINTQEKQGRDFLLRNPKNVFYISLVLMLRVEFSKKLPEIL